MEDLLLASLFEPMFYLFSTGRRSFAMRQVKKAAASAGFIDLAVHCDVGLAHDAQTLDLEARWGGYKPDVQHSAEARQIDIDVDAALFAFRNGLDSAARASAADDPLGDAAEKLALELFPKGVAAITTLAFVEEHGQLKRILAHVNHPDWSQTVQDLGLARQVTRLTALEPKYEAAIQTPGGKVAFSQVRDARAKGQSLMLQAVAMILGRHPSDSPADLAGRAGLLGPILTQNEAIRAYLKARRAVEDVNPETGEVETPAPAATGAPPPAESSPAKPA